MSQPILERAGANETRRRVDVSHGRSGNDNPEHIAALRRRHPMSPRGSGKQHRSAEFTGSASSQDTESSCARINSDERERFTHQEPVPQNYPSFQNIHFALLLTERVEGFPADPSRWHKPWWTGEWCRVDMNDLDCGWRDDPDWTDLWHRGATGLGRRRRDHRWQRMRRAGWRVSWRIPRHRADRSLLQQMRWRNCCARWEKRVICFPNPRCRLPILHHCPTIPTIRSFAIWASWSVMTVDDTNGRGSNKPTKLWHTKWRRQPRLLPPTSIPPARFSGRNADR